VDVNLTEALVFCLFGGRQAKDHECWVKVADPGARRGIAGQLRPCWRSRGRRGRRGRRRRRRGRLGASRARADGHAAAIAPAHPAISPACCRTHRNGNVTQPNLSWVAVVSAKIHKRQRRKRQSVTAK